MAAALLALAGATAAPPRPLVAAYYMGTGNPDAPAALPAERYDILLWAFLTVCGTDPAANAHQRARRDEDCGARRGSEIAAPAGARAAELAALRALKARNPRLRIIGSAGGWGMPYYPELVADPARRAAFVRSAAALVADGTLDGIDLDWEYPGGGDPQRPDLAGAALTRERAAYTALVTELRAAIDAAASRAGRPRPLLTAAVAATPVRVAAIDWQALGPVFDLVFAMSYDFTAGDQPPGHHANLRATAATGGNGADVQLARLRAAGVPAERLMLGVPFYGREWTGVRRDPATGALTGKPTGRSPLWKELAAEREGVAYDAAAEAPYLLAGQRYVTFANPRSIAAARCLVHREGYGGLFAWEATQDDGALLAAMAEERSC
jgi:chitinase